jgi:hypothetical protein
MKEEITQKLIESTATSITTEEEAKIFVDEILDVVDAIKIASTDSEITFDEVKNILIETCEAIISTLEEIATCDEGIAMLVVELLKDIYYDPRGFDDPDIPYVPDWLEIDLEKAFFDFALPMVAKAITSLVRI